MAIADQTEQQTDTTPSGQAPPSQSEAAQALVAAAKHLLTQSPPSAITGRQLASEARVNYGLVHRHFGSKTAVFKQALNEFIDDYVQDAYDPTDLLTPLRVLAHMEGWRAFVQVLLDRGSLSDYHPHSVGTIRYLKGLRRTRSNLDPNQIQPVVALGLVMELGVPFQSLFITPDTLNVDLALVHDLTQTWHQGLQQGFGPLGREHYRPLISDDPTPAHPPKPPRKHRGRASVEERLVEAGTQLMTRQAPSGISGRQLAATAGVNYGLIHHYFGSKDEVLRQSIQLHHDLLAESVATDGAQTGVPGLSVLRQHPAYLRALVHAWVVDGTQPQSGEISVRRDLAQRWIRPDQTPEDQAATAAALVVALATQLAWAVFEPVLTQAFQSDSQLLEPVVGAMLLALISEPLGGLPAANPPPG